MKADTKLEIHELLSRSAYALDERDFDMLEATFAPDAEFVIDIAGNADEISFSGRDAIMGLMRDAGETQTDKRRHVVSNVFFEVAANDRAEVISNVTITSVENNAVRLVTTGLYRDRVVLVDGGWCIARRRIELDMAY